MSPETRITPEVRYHLDLKGYHVQRRAFPESTLETLERSLLDLEAGAPSGLPPTCPSTWTPAVNEMRLFNLVDCGEPFEELIDHPAILDWVREFVPGPQRLTEAYSITRGRGIGLPLHRIQSARYYLTGEGPRCDHLTAVVFLSDCGPEDGPMVVFEGTHKLMAPFPYNRVHPDWDPPAHDRGFIDSFMERGEGRGDAVAWEDIPGYRELHVRRGDLIVFVQSLWHGAKDLRSDRVRRSLYYSYSPYHFANWHGVTFSDELKARVTPLRRRLLSGPFIGSRYAGIDTRDIPDCDEFPVQPESELGPRPIVAPHEEEIPSFDRFLEAASMRYSTGAREAAGRDGRCHLRLHGERGGDWSVEFQNGSMSVERRVRPGADTWIETSVEDLVRLVQGQADVAQVFYNGRVTVRGDMGLAMRLASLLVSGSR
jgi:putative sterol carrier protein